jgi:predicted TIM-barrel fold metal-dependent hydrolase
MKHENSTFRKAVMLREKLEGELVIDAHTHIGSRSSIYHLPDSSNADLVREMDRLGVSQAITFSFAGVTSDYVLGNDVCAQAVSEYPDRFIGFTVVNPHYHTEMKAELERCRAMGLRGIKLISDYQLYPVEGPGLFPAYEYAHEHGLMILSHNWGPPAFLDKLATTFSNACFILGHYFSGAAAGYAEVVAKRDNVYQCTCAALNFGDHETMVDLMPVEKIVFGSDVPDLPTMFSLAPILYARISDDAKRKIIGLNAKAMIDRWPGT